MVKVLNKLLELLLGILAIVLVLALVFWPVVVFFTPGLPDWLLLVGLAWMFILTGYMRED